MFQPRPWFLVGLLIYTLGFRLLPYSLDYLGLENIDPATTTWPWNLSPLFALCLYGAAHFSDRKWGYLVPMGAMLIGDLGIWALTGRTELAFYPYQIFVYASMALMISAGLILRRHRSIPAIAGVGLAASVLFFLVTNFGVWLLGEWTPYSRDLAGLMECYAAGIPYFRNTLISMAFFSALLFSPLAVRPCPQQPAPAAAQQ